MSALYSEELKREVRLAREVANDLALHLFRGQSISFNAFLQTGTLRFEDAKGHTINTSSADGKIKSFVRIHEIAKIPCAVRRIVVVDLPDEFAAASFVWVSMDGHPAGARFEMPVMDVSKGGV